MATITVRNIDPEIVTALKALGAKHGRSMEAEARLLISEGVRPDSAGHNELGLGSRIRARFAGLDTADLHFTRNAEPPRAAIFEE